MKFRSHSLACLLLPSTAWLHRNLGVFGLGSCQAQVAGGAISVCLPPGKWKWWKQKVKCLRVDALFLGKSREWVLAGWHLQFFTFLRNSWGKCKPTSIQSSTPKATNWVLDAAGISGEVRARVRPGCTKLHFRQRMEGDSLENLLKKLCKKQWVKDQFILWREPVFNF